MAKGREELVEAHLLDRLQVLAADAGGERQSIQIDAAIFAHGFQGGSQIRAVAKSWRRGRQIRMIPQERFKSPVTAPVSNGMATFILVPLWRQACGQVTQQSPKNL